jgi:hypothetical protein
MNNGTNVIYRLVAVLFVVIGVAAMVAAWFVLLTTATRNASVVALEIGGVVICLAGYFIWKRTKVPGK